MNDLQTNASLFSEDIEDQGVFTDKETSNYRYGRISNLSKDVSEGIDTIIWNAYGKIRAIRFNNRKPDLSFMYDATGNRIGKLVHSVTDNSKIERGDIYWRGCIGQSAQHGAVRHRLKILSKKLITLAKTQKK